MELQLNNIQNVNLVHSCNSHQDRHRDGFQIKVGNYFYSQSLILTPENLEMWGVDEISVITAEDVKKLTSFNVEVAILGTGAGMIFPSASITYPLIKAGIGFEVMDTPAACRTYNILVADGRKVAAGLIL